MKKAVGLLFAALVAAISAPALAANSGDKAAIERVSNEFIAAWNAHDPKKMAAVWAEDGDLINPMGQSAHGRADIEKFFEKEQSTAMKGTTYKLESMSVRELGPNVASADWESVVTGMVDPSGKEMPPFKHHVFVVYVKKGGHWHTASVRAFGYQTPPPGAPAPK